MFVCALAIFFTVANKFRRDLSADGSLSLAPPAAPGPSVAPYLAKVAAILALSTIFGIDALHANQAQAGSHKPVLAALPQHLGSYTLLRTWSDALVSGTIVYTWGEYASTLNQQAPHVSLGISPVFGVHDAEVCHMARDEEPTWHGQIDAASSAGAIHLTAATYNDGTVQSLEASTVCERGICNQFSTTSKHITMVYSYPYEGLPMQKTLQRSVPVLLKVQASDPAAPGSVLEPRLAATLKDFLRGVNLVTLTAPYSNR
jgi:exosortase J